MRPTRKTQPYRKRKGRPAGATLESILRGEPATMPHPSKAKRRLRKRRSKRSAYSK